MVASSGLSVLLFAADVAPPAAPRAAEIDPPTRATLLLALLGLILMGLTLIVMTSIGARMVRRWARSTPPRRVIGKSSRPPVPLDLSLFDESNSSATLHDDDNDAGNTIV